MIPSTLTYLKIEFDHSSKEFNVITVDEWRDVFPTAPITTTTLAQTKNGNNQFILENDNTLLHQTNGKLRGKFVKLTPSEEEIVKFSGELLLRRSIP